MFLLSTCSWLWLSSEDPRKFKPLHNACHVAFRNVSTHPCLWLGSFKVQQNQFLEGVLRVFPQEEGWTGCPLKVPSSPSHPMVP